MSAVRPYIDGSYILHEKLGRGGMATVYRATKRANSMQVALKLVGKDEDLAGDHASAQPRLRLALAHEFRTLSSLHHPNIIRVQDYGFDKELGPYYTMEMLVSPQTIVEAAAEQPLRDKILLLAQLLRAVIYLHRRGVLHRDLKPSNVLVVHGKVQVVDFGIAVVASLAEDTAGTLEYMAPELLLGGQPSVASDQYAVGMIAYQMITGNLPFDRISTTRILEQLLGTRSDLTVSAVVADFLAAHRRGRVPQGKDVAITESGEPETPGQTAAADELEKKLAALEGPIGNVLRKLLARQPEARYDNLGQVLLELGAVIGEPLPVENAAIRESFLQASKLVGRDAELGTLTSALARAAHRKGGSWLLGGESGVGKSRLLAELRTLALVEQVWVAEGQCVAAGGSPYQEWLSVLPTLCLHTELSQFEATVLKGLVPDIELLLGREVPDPPRMQPAMAQERLLNTICQLLARQCKPGLIILEDMQWVRSESMALLQHLSSLAATLPVLFVVSYRSDESPNLPAQLPAMQELKLQRLDRASIAQLSASMLGAVGERPELVDYLCAQTAGNVFFLVEIVRALAEDAGHLGGIRHSALPAVVSTYGIERVIAQRVSSVSAADRPLLMAAATLGRQIDHAVMKHLFPAVDLDRWIINYANAAILEIKDSDCRFTHDKLREAILSGLDGETRRQLHNQIAQALEAVYSGPSLESRSEALAYHYQQARVLDKARDYFMRAGERALRLCIYTEAHARYKSTLQMIDELPDSQSNRRCKVSTLMRMAQTGMLIEKAEQLFRWLETARQLLQGLDSPQGVGEDDRFTMARLNCLCGQVHYFLGQPAEAIGYYRQVLPVAQEFGDPELLAMPAYMIGVALAIQGHTYKAVPLLAQAIEPLACYGNTAEWMRALLYHGHALMASGHYQSGLLQIDRAHARAKELGSLELTTMSYAVRSSFFRTCGDWPETILCADQTLALAEQKGTRIYIAVSLGYKAWAQSHLGNYDQAVENRVQAQQIAATLGGRMVLTNWFAAADCEIALNGGRYKQVIELATDLLPKLQSDGELLAQLITQRSVSIARGMLSETAAEAAAPLEACVRALEDSGNLIEAARTHLWWGRLSVRHGDAAHAQRHFNAALAQLAGAGCAYAHDEAQRLAAGLDQTESAVDA